MPQSEAPSINGRDWLLIGVLLALVLPLRAWLLYNTEVTARDSIGYIRYALEFERLPWDKVWKDNIQHPGYPMSIAAASIPVRSIAGETTPETVALSAQLVSMICSFIVAILMYLLGRQFFDGTISFGAALLYQYLPVSAHYLSDGISEPLYLTLLLAAILHLVVALRGQSPLLAGLGGILAGMAYITRPEGLLIVPVFAGALVLMQCRASWRMPWLRFAGCTLALVLCAGLVMAIYVYATGRFTNKLSAIEVMENVKAAFLRAWQWLTGSGAQEAHGAGGPLFALTFTPTESKAGRFFQGLFALTTEIVQGYHYAGAIPAVLGFLWAFAELRARPAFWALMFFSGLHCLVLIALAMSVSYVSERHVMILVIFGSYFTVLGLRELPKRVLAWSRGEPASESEVLPWYRVPAVWFVLLLTLMIAACLPKSLQRLHGNRDANHAAGLWLRGVLVEGDHVEDDHGWSAFYAGYVLKEGQVPILPAEQVPTTYVVVTRSRDAEIDAKRQLVGENARVVWPAPNQLAKSRVIVYAQPRDYVRNPWTKK